MLSSYDTNAYETKGSLDKRRISSKLHADDASNDSDYPTTNKYSGYNSSSGLKGKKRRNQTLSKTRAGTTKYRGNVRSTNSVSFKSTLPPNDFDVMTVNDGLDEIDIMIDELENDIPEDVYENENLDVDQMMKVNRDLRDKIKEIGGFVITAITKASQLK
jgi:hypothetical protein